MNVKEMTDLEVAVAFSAVTTEAIERGLLKPVYHQNAKSIARHVGRMIIDIELAKTQGK